MEKSSDFTPLPPHEVLFRMSIDSYGEAKPDLRTARLAAQQCRDATDSVRIFTSLTRHCPEFQLKNRLTCSKSDFLVTTAILSFRSQLRPPSPRYYHLRSDYYPSQCHLGYHRFISRCTTFRPFEVRACCVSNDFLQVVRESALEDDA